MKSSLIGYEQDIDEMLKANKGLKSRFSEKMVFLDFDVNTIGELLTREIVKECNNGENLNEDILKSMPEIATRLKSAPDFGNGRDVNTLVKRVYREFAKSKSESVSLEVINRALEGFLDSKKSVEQSNLPSSCNTTKPQHFAQASDSFIAPSISTATKKVVQEEKIDEEVEHTNQESSDLNKNKFLQLLQDILDERGLNSKEGVQTLSSLTVDSAEFHELAQEISNKLGIPLQNAIDMIIGWQEEQANVYEKLEEQEREMEKAKQEKRKAKVPIWRCGVCGRADKPYIACYVRPFIVRYEETEI